MLGSQVLAWDEMRHFIKPEFRWQDELQLEIRSRPYSAVTGVSKIGHWRALMSLISYGSQRRGLIDTLYFVIKYAAVCQATDPRDKVYGLRTRNRSLSSFAAKLTNQQLDFLNVRCFP